MCGLLFCLGNRCIVGDMSYWKKKQLVLTEGYEEDDAPITVLTEGGSHLPSSAWHLFDKHLYSGGPSWSDFRNPRGIRCGREHEYWVIHVDQLDLGDASAPNFDKGVVSRAKGALRTMRKYVAEHGGEVPLSVVVLRHPEEVIVNEAEIVTVDLKESVAQARREAARPEREERQRQANLARIGRETPHWPELAEQWRRVSDNELVLVVGVSGWGREKMIHWKSATYLGRDKVGDFIGDYRWIEPDE